MANSTTHILDPTFNIISTLFHFTLISPYSLWLQPPNRFCLNYPHKGFLYNHPISYHSLPPNFLASLILYLIVICLQPPQSYCGIALKNASACLLMTKSNGLFLFLTYLKSLQHMTLWATLLLDPLTPLACFVLGLLLARFSFPTSDHLISIEILHSPQLLLSS